MDGVTQKMREMIRGWDRGRIFFLDDFATLESPGAVRFALLGMVKEGFIIRLARGVYCYPEISGEFAMKRIIPSDERIAHCIAEKEKVRIIPYGDQAAYKLGLTTMRISDLKYLTDGAPRKINLSATRKIYFNHTDEVKMFGYRNETMQDIASAIRFLTEEMIDGERKRVIHKHLRTVPEEDFRHDITTEIWNN